MNEPLAMSPPCDSVDDDNNTVQNTSERLLQFPDSVSLSTHNLHSSGFPPPLPWLVLWVMIET